MKSNWSLVKDTTGKCSPKLQESAWEATITTPRVINLDNVNKGMLLG